MASVFTGSTPKIFSFGFKAWSSLIGIKRMEQGHVHTDIEINLLPESHIDLFVGGKVHKIPKNHLFIFWGGTPHQMLDITVGTPSYWVTIPMGLFMQWKLNETFVRQLMEGHLFSDGQSEESKLDLTLNQRWSKDFENGSSELRKIVMLEVEARLRRFSINIKPHTSTTQKQTSAGNLASEPVVQYVVKNFRNPLSIQQIAKEFHFHPNYLMGLFKRNYGIPLWEYIIRTRIWNAQSLLISTDSKILDVAYESGFGSLSRFNEAFHRICGCSPRQYRQSTKWE